MATCVRCGYTADAKWYVEPVRRAQYRVVATTPPDVVICTDCMEEIV